jgi:hypothetical protein
MLHNYCCEIFIPLIFHARLPTIMCSNHSWIRSFLCMIEFGMVQCISMRGRWIDLDKISVLVYRTCSAGHDWNSIDITSAHTLICKRQSKFLCSTRDQLWTSEGGCSSRITIELDSGCGCFVADSPHNTLQYTQYTLWVTWRRQCYRRMVLSYIYSFPTFFLQKTKYKICIQVLLPNYYSVAI